MTTSQERVDGENAPTGASAVNPRPERVVDSDKVWTTLITNTKYLSGLLTLDASLKYVGSKYPLVALYTDTFPPEGHAALDRRGIPKKHTPYLLPKTHKDFTNDPRFYDCWSKLTPFSLVEYERVVQLDSDMLVLQKMDELMEIELDGADMKGKGRRVFAASHACVCNPLNKPHYPRDWIPENCAFTTQHDTPDKAQVEGAPPTAGLAMPNGGLQVVVPSADVYDLILSALQGDKTINYDFADQSILSDLFPGRWVALPYIYNALKTLRWKGVHDAIWRDDKVKNMHYLLSPKPWDESPDEGKRKEGRNERNEANDWWWDVHERRLKEEKARGIDDGF
ncbi:glycosyltransferase family 8 protein [Baudoinia panamericana UAMH 10762]|uniref:Glycosyltransferase family 8 protein n=1 Tax=Baudoinia panamericana (strain UAMH 10762) TaxID=717646 RepID=M2N5V3_BAUPA|nr:glycosyltransferase family 8 protein [Baudoinia panamericana UAMH 10762]EMC99408.1 glycosyltransferase family 8 protein [Baudoinia panamericana UAMH 10762]